MSNMYTSALDDTLQSEMSRNTNRQTRLPPYLQRRLLESLVIASLELEIQDFTYLRNMYGVSVLDVVEDQWRDAYKEYIKKDKSLLTAAIFQAQSPRLDEILDMIISQRLKRDQAKEAILIWVNQEYQSARENAKIMISNAVREGEEMIQEANITKAQIIDSANEAADGIIESAKTVSMTIIDDAKRKSSQIIDDALKRSRIEKKQKDEMIKKLTDEIDSLQRQRKQIMQEKESIEKEKNEIFVESIKLARNSNMEKYYLSATTQQENRRNQSISEREWNARYRESQINENQE